MIDFFSRIRRLRAKIAQLPLGARDAYGSRKKAVLRREKIGRADNIPISQIKIDRRDRRHVFQSSPKPTAYLDPLLAPDVSEESDVAAFQSDLELMLASMSAALMPNHWQDEGDGDLVRNLDSTLENHVADAVRRLPVRAIGV